MTKHDDLIQRLEKPIARLVSFTVPPVYEDDPLHIEAADAIRELVADQSAAQAERDELFLTIRKVSAGEQYERERAEKAEADLAAARAETAAPEAPSLTGYAPFTPITVSAESLTRRAEKAEADLAAAQDAAAEDAELMRRANAQYVRCCEQNSRLRADLAAARASAPEERVVNWQEIDRLLGLDEKETTNE